MDWQGRYFPPDVFPGLVDRVEDLIAAGRFISPALVKEEVAAVGTTDLIAWTENHAEIFVPTVAILAEAQAIQNQFAGLSDPRAEYEEADAYVIALARIRSGIVVTQETRRRRSVIPSALISFPMFAVSWAFPASAFSV